MNLELLLEPLQYGFMVRAFVGVGLVAVVAAAIGTFVVLKGCLLYTSCPRGKRWIGLFPSLSWKWCSRDGW